MKSGLLLDVVVLESAAILKLLAREDETLLVWWDALLVLDLGLDGFDGIGAFNLEGDGLAGKSLDEDLHGLLFRLLGSIRGFIASASCNRH